MIGMVHRPVGQLGNQLFQLNSLWQMSEYLDTDYFYQGFDSLSELGLRNAKKPHYGQLIRPIKILNLNSITKALDSGNLSGLFASSRNWNYLVPAGLMGEYFFDLLFKDPRYLLDSQRTNENMDTRNYVKVALHFRGKDFESWNPKSIMKTDYYKKAIFEIVSENERKSMQISIFTDDPQNVVVQELLTWKDYNFHLSDGSLKQDFLEMSSSDYIVASPSTFAFWASLSWNQPKMIYSHEWIEHRLEVKDKFWGNYLVNEKFNIRIHKIV
jgi:hypothetical protein